MSDGCNGEAAFFSVKCGYIFRKIRLTLPSPDRLLIEVSMAVRGNRTDQYPVSRDLAAKTALCCFGLLPAELYADALQEEVPEAEWAAELLREWAKVERENA